MATKTLRECLEDLPQELYDKIYQHTFAAPDKDTVISITGCYKPPSTSQVNRATRESFQSCYKQCTFVAEVWTLIPWLHSLHEPERFENIVCWLEKAKDYDGSAFGPLITMDPVEECFDRRVTDNVVATNNRETASELSKMSGVHERHRSSEMKWSVGGVQLEHLIVYIRTDNEQDEWGWVAFPTGSLAHKYGFS